MRVAVDVVVEVVVLNVVVATVLGATVKAIFSCRSGQLGGGMVVEDVVALERRCTSTQILLSPLLGDTTKFQLWGCQPRVQVWRVCVVAKLV